MQSLFVQSVACFPPSPFPFSPFLSKNTSIFLSTNTSIDQETTKGTMSHQTLMATSSYSTVHVTILSMLFSFLGGNLSVPVPINVDNTMLTIPVHLASFFSFRGKQDGLITNSLCSLLKVDKVIRRKVKKKVKVIPHLHFPLLSGVKPRCNHCLALLSSISSE